MPLVIAGFFSGAIADRVNRKRILGFSIVAQAVCTFLIGFVTNFVQVLILRFCLGLSAAFFIPAAMGLILDYFPEK